WLRRRLAERLQRGDEGSAVVEFLGAALILLIPVVYLIVALAQVQAATFAADTAAREAGRVIAGADTFPAGSARAATAVELAFADQGITVDGAQVLHVVCEADPCLTPGSYVHLEVATAVDLPLVPDILAEELGTGAHRGRGNDRRRRVPAGAMSTVMSTVMCTVRTIRAVLGRRRCAW